MTARTSLLGVIKRSVDAIVTDIKSRGGLDGAWEDIDATTQRDIELEWFCIIRNRFTEEATRQALGLLKPDSRICEECEMPEDSEPHKQHCPEAIRG